jgi:phosphate transport system substrate-binding protein
MIQLKSDESMKNIKNAFPLLFIVIILLVSCNSAGSRKQKISISGGFALYPLMVKWAELYMKENHRVQIDISAGGAGKGMTDVISEMVDIAMISREIDTFEIQNGAYNIAVAKDAVVPVFNSSNPIAKEILERGIDSSKLAKIFITGELTKWNEIGASDQPPLEIHLFTRSDACGAAKMWATYFGKEQEDLKGTGVFGDPGVADAIKNDILGLGYNNLVYVFDPHTGKKNPGLEILPIDLNADGKIDSSESFYHSIDKLAGAIKEGRYPSPPARYLYLVTKGKPNEVAVINFLRWILTEGQQYVEESGYVKLSDPRKKAELLKID